MSSKQTINEFDQVVGQEINDWVPAKKPEKINLEGAYCSLIPLDIPLHAAALFEAFQYENQGESWTYLPYGPFDTYQEFHNWLANIACGDDPFFYTIMDKKNNKPVGMCAYGWIDPQHGVIEAAHIHFSKYLKNTPAATEAMYLMMHYAFEDLHYRRYQWRCNALNKPSWFAAERLGFKFEGIFRQHNVCKNRNRDTAWFSILDHEWPVLKTKFQKWLDLSNFSKEGKQKVSLRDM
jgi:RimJ/RimL family protein N-acetyltransferase